MSLADIVRTGISLADKITEGGELQEPVSHQAWIGQDGFGDPSYAAGVSVPALVEYGVDHVFNAEGQQIPVQAKVTILRPLAPNGAGGRQEPVDPRDRITLPDGSSGPIAKVLGLVDGGTGGPYMLEVWIGR